MDKYNDYKNCWKEYGFTSSSSTYGVIKNFKSGWFQINQKSDGDTIEVTLKYHGEIRMKDMQDFKMQITYLKPMLVKLNKIINRGTK